MPLQNENKTKQNRKKRVEKIHFCKWFIWSFDFLFVSILVFIKFLVFIVFSQKKKEKEKQDCPIRSNHLLQCSIFAYKFHLICMSLNNNNTTFLLFLLIIIIISLTVHKIKCQFSNMKTKTWWEYSCCCCCCCYQIEQSCREKIGIDMN